MAKRKSTTPSTLKPNVGEDSELFINIDANNPPIYSFDTILGSVSPKRGLIVVHLCVDHASIPIQLVVKGGKITEKVGREGVQRTVLATLRMDMHSAKQLQHLLNKELRTLQNSDNDESEESER